MLPLSLLSHEFDRSAKSIQNSIDSQTTPKSHKKHPPGPNPLLTLLFIGTIHIIRWQIPTSIPNSPFATPHTRAQPTPLW